MSRPANLLDKFRSYSYHHTLIACDSTETAHLLKDAVDLKVTDEALTFSEHPDNRYKVLIDGRVHAETTIKTVKWSNVLAPTVDGAGRYRSVGTTVQGTMVIEEFQGMNFLNILNTTFDQLGTDASGVVYVLKTTFIGHTDKGTVEEINNVKPQWFIVINLEASIDELGTEYTLEFVGVTNGGGQLPTYNLISDGFKYKIEKNATVTSALKGLFAKINQHYDSYKTRLAEDIQCSGKDINLDNFRQVFYEIKVDSLYDDYAVGTVPLVQQQNSTGSDPIIVNGKEVSIKSLIHKIMETSQQVVDDTKDNTESPHAPFNKRVFDIHTTVESTPTRYAIVFHVVSKLIPIQGTKPGTKPEPMDGNKIEFDYIFTGKNIDILDFDVKMQHGLAFLHTLSAANNLPSPIDNRERANQQNTSAAVAGQPSYSVTDASKEARVRTPLPLGLKLSNPLFANKRNATEFATYKSLLQRHAMIETVSTSIKIRGNPRLLSELTLHPRDMFTVENPTVGPSGQERGNTIAERPDTVPIFAKVNVSMPTKDPTSLRYSEPFWYQDWYTIRQVNNIFNNGEFLQELEMHAIPFDDGSIVLASSGSSTLDDDDPCAHKEPIKDKNSEVTGKPDKNDTSSDGTSFTTKGENYRSVASGMRPRPFSKKSE